MPVHGLAVDLEALAAQLCRDPPRAVERVLGVDLVNSVLERDLLRQSRHRLVVKAGSIEAEQVGLGLDRETWVVKVKQRKAFSPSQVGYLFS